MWVTTPPTQVLQLGEAVLTLLAVPEDVPLMGCHFYIVDYPNFISADMLDIWKKVSASGVLFMLTLS